MPKKDTAVNQGNPVGMDHSETYPSPLPHENVAEDHCSFSVGKIQVSVHLEEGGPCLEDLLLTLLIRERDGLSSLPSSSGRR